MGTPFNFQGNYAYSPRDARRQAKAYVRAQRNAVRSQRAYGRMYRRRSILGPIMLLSFGILALLVETNRISNAAFWSWYAQWWPLIIIGMGLILLAEYFVDRNNPMGGGSRVGGLVFFVILIASLGYTSDGMRNFGGFGREWSDRLGYDNGGDLFSMLGEEHDNEATVSLPVSKNALIDIENARGDVTLAASNDDSVHVDARQVVHGSDEDARRAFAETKPRLLATAAGANVTVAGRDGASVALTIAVPAGSSANIRTSHGDVVVAAVKRVDVTQVRGDVKLDDISGDVHVQIDHGDVTVNSVAGDVAVDGNANDVSLSGVKGRATLNGDFFGDTRLDQIGSAVHFHSSRTDLTIPKLAGSMSLDPGDLSLSGPSGGLVLTTRSKDIEVTGLIGDAHIQNSNGNINVAAAQPLGNVEITAGTGELTMTLPSNASFAVDASVGKGQEIDSDFPLTKQGDEDSSQTLSGVVGHGGPRLVLRSAHGELSLRKGDLATAPAPPEPPTAPEPPAKVRHLKAGPTPPEPSAQ